MHITRAMPTSDLRKGESVVARSTSDDFLLSATARMSQILAANSLRVRVSVGTNAIDLGDFSVSKTHQVEFIFKSHDVFERVMRRMRLMDFALCYFSGDMLIGGLITNAIDVIDLINGATDRRQTFLENLQQVAFQTAKAVFPGVQKRFESLEHYSQDAAAYELFLDDHMQYTCGRYITGNENITEAQIAKFQLIEELAAKELGSLKGRDHLDIGCGWGGMGAYFQEVLGTISVGNTNCERQMRYAQVRYGSDVIFGDFAALNGTGRRFDLVTVVGMMEHLTPYRRSQLLSVIGRVLKPNGVAYLQCITKPSVWIGGDAYRVAQKIVFPGHYLETADQTAKRIEAGGFKIIYSMDGARDYGLTTAQWAEALQRNETQMIALVGEKKYRIFLGYLAFASKMFSTGRGGLMRYMFKRV